MFVQIRYCSLKYQRELKWTLLLSLYDNPAWIMPLTSQMQYVQNIFIISPKCQKTFFFSVNGIIIHPATQGRNLGITWSLPFPLVTHLKQSPSSFLLNLSLYTFSPFPWLAAVIVQVLIISYILIAAPSRPWRGCAYISLVHSPYEARSVTATLKALQWLPTAIKIKSNSLKWFARPFEIWSLHPLQNHVSVWLHIHQ